jgi:hypothetical protein
MRVFSSRQFAGSALLLTTAVVLCLGTLLLSHSASESELSVALTMVGAPHAEPVANGHPIEGKYPAMLAEEDEVSDGLPKNAVLLSALVLVYFYGPALGWLLVSGWRGSRPEDTSPIMCCSHSIVHLYQRRTVASLLEVFRM